MDTFYQEFGPTYSSSSDTEGYTTPPTIFYGDTQAPKVCRIKRKMGRDSVAYLITPAVRIS